jgi:hypothetical protein
MTDVQTLVRENARTADAPAKRWRNLWRHGKGVAFESGYRVDAGEHLGPQVFPSREIAEQRALDWQREFAEVVETCGVVYLGPIEDLD